MRQKINMRLINKILAKNYSFLIFVSVIVVFIMGLPILYGFFINDKYHYYTGLNTIAVIDGPVYLSYIEQVKAGHFLFRDLFNSNDNFQFLNPFWLLVGLVAKILNLSAPFTLQFFRIILIPFFLFSTFKIVDLLFKGSNLQKKICFLYSLIVSGLGLFFYSLLLLITAKPEMMDIPLDLWAYEANNFMVLRYYPHVLFSISLIFLIFYYFFKAIEDESNKKAMIVGILALLLFSFHPFQIPLVYAISLFYLLILFIINKKISWDYIKKYLLMFFISLPSVLYYIYQLFFNKNILLKAIQNNNFTPSLPIFIISFGLGLFLALYYSYYIFKKGQFTKEKIFLITWFLGNIILVYSPLNFQRRMLGGFILPLAILSFYVLLMIFEKIKSKSKALKIILALTLFFFFSLSDWYVYNQDFKYLKIAAAGEVEHQDLVYVSQEIKEALDWYKENSNDNDIILASYERGNLIPGLTGKKVYMGHPIETIDFAEKKDKVNYFFSTNSHDYWKQNFIKNNKITYIFYSDFEKKLGSFEPDKYAYLKEVFKNNKASIYKVNFE